MFRRRLTLVLVLIATVVVATALLAAASLAVTERQVVRGRVASDIAAAFIQLSAQKQRLRTWVAQRQQGASANEAARAELQAAMQGTLLRLQALAQQAVELDGGAEAREEHLRRRETLDLLQDSVAALVRAVNDAGPLPAGADPLQAWEAQSRLFDMAGGRDVRLLIAENIARETAAVQRERAAADAVMAWVRWLWLGAAMVLAATALGAVLYFGRALRHPLQQLSEGAHALQDGRLDHRIPLQGDDEFAEVARSVNALAAELEAHRARESAQRQHLEDQVAARTRELADALASLRQADAQRRRLFADISHELRTPTTVIRGEAEITLRGVDKPAAEYRQALTRIVDTARQLGSVIDDLLAMARSDIDSLSLSREPVDLDELAAEALAQAAPLASRHGVRLAPAPPRTGSHVVDGDPLRLRQLLGVLLDNATRYSRPGGEVTLRLATKASHEPAPTVSPPAPGAAPPTWLEVRVQDQGIGIAPHELAQVFDRHFRGAQARRHCPDGSGLGLSIARTLAQAHGGQLHLESNDLGTCAVLRLPLAIAPARTAGGPA
ncbi:sensor histidine kinase [Ideonella livida]|uniref:histidine kinase n=1 Tax=Ideonella livida TaxID=2707176 RepID=A0A7C9PKT2_9BURK|nr:HAMP domain-containing sensor histidine kinase [Ideonella livida]NDY93770.1 HAMP domain-containing histidine kinase [Ideonella livida]